MERTPQEKQQIAQELIERAMQGFDVSDADPRETSIEAVVTANKILKAGGKVIQLTL